MVQVNYVGKGANLYKAGYELSGSSYVISKYLGTSWLWVRTIMCLPETLVPRLCSI